MTLIYTRRNDESRRVATLAHGERQPHYGSHVNELPAHDAGTREHRAAVKRLENATRAHVARFLSS